MKLNKFITDLITNSINKISPPRNLEEGMFDKEMETQTYSQTAVSSEQRGGYKEEQCLFILRMLANKKINSEEALGLLDALDGEPELICNAYYI